MFIPLRDDGPPLGKGRFPIVTAAFCLANIVVFMVQQLLPPTTGAHILYAGGAVPWEIVHLRDYVDGLHHPPDVVPPPFTIFTSLFLHGSIEHLLGNLWFLWMFGRGVERRLGAFRFAAFYFLAGFLATGGQALMTPTSLIPIVGASGAIAGLLGAYVAIDPRAKVEILLFVVVVVDVVIAPAFVVLGIWFIWQLLVNSGGQVAVWAHVWGFLIGATLGRLLVLKPSPTRSWNLSTLPV